MRIVIDLQGAQSGSRFRGIGRYSLALATAMARDPGDHEFHVLLNARFPDSIEPIKSAFNGSIAEDRFHIWKPMRNAGVVGDEGADERIREAFLASLNPDFVHISSLMDGMGDPLVASVGAYTCRLRTAVTLYDLIPLIHSKIYLSDHASARWYHGRLAHLRRADLLLGISSSAAQEAIDHLGFPAESVVNISSAIDDSFVRLDADALDAAELRSRYGLVKPFVMYTGGIDHRKNIEGLIRAYAQLPASIRKSHQLAVVCSVSDAAKNALLMLGEESGLGSGELIFTGFIPDADLVRLYNATELFVFPSWHEGFGLPALEAMQCGAPVIGSNTSSLPEVIGLDEALFDPFDIGAIAQKIEQGLVDESFRQRLVENSQRQVLRFSWEISARKAIEAMEVAHIRREKEQESASHQPVKRLRLAFVSPVSPERSGIADYSSSLIPELSRFYDVDVITCQDQVDDGAVLGSSRVRDLNWFNEHGGGYDRVLYHLGNSSFHAHMPEMLDRTPGVVVLHDFFLSGLCATRELVLADTGSWPDAIYRSHGYFPLLDFVEGRHEHLAANYPCNFQVLSSALGVIVHSVSTKGLADAYYGPGLSSDWHNVPLLRRPVEVSSAERRRIRGALGFSEGALLISSFGFMAPSKCNRSLLDAWLASPLAGDENCYLVFVGEPPSGPYGEDFIQAVAASGASDRIVITGYANAEQYRQYLAAADIAVQLRSQSRGETSASLLDALNYGLPTIVNAHGSMADLPDDGLIKLPDEFAVEDLSAALVKLSVDPEMRAELAEAGRRRVRTDNLPRKCAAEYAAAIEESYLRAGEGAYGLVAAVGAHIAQSGAAVDEARFGEALAWSFPGRRSARQALVDVSDLDCSASEASADLRRVLLAPPSGWRVEPVRRTAAGYVYARAFALALIGCPPGLLADDEALDVSAGDVLLSLSQVPDTIDVRSLGWRGVGFQAWSQWVAEHAGAITSSDNQTEQR